MSVIINPGSGGSSGRTVLTGDATYYVSPIGSDSNPGTVLLPWATAQHAYNTITGTLDFSGFDVTIQMVDGSYTSNGCIDTTNQPSWIGGGRLIWQGNLSNQTNVSIDASGANAVLYIGNGTTLNGTFIIQYMALANTGGNELVSQQGFGYVKVINCNAGVVNKGSGNSVHFSAGVSGAILEIDGDYSITHGAEAHILAYYTGALIWYFPSTVTAVGTIDFDQAFALAQEEGDIDSSGVNFVGTFTGDRFEASTNGILETYTGSPSNPNYYPGDKPGHVFDGGQYSGLSNHAIATPTTGGTVSMELLHPSQILTPAGTLATLTVNLPPIETLTSNYSENGSFAYISTTQTITALTVATTDGSTIVGAPTTLAADTGFGMIYDITANTWYPWIGQSSGGSSSLVVNSTPISGGVAQQLLYDNGGTLEEANLTISVGQATFNIVGNATESGNYGAQLSLNSSASNGANNYNFFSATTGFNGHSFFGVYDNTAGGFGPSFNTIQGNNPGILLSTNCPWITWSSDSTPGHLPDLFLWRAGPATIQLGYNFTDHIAQIIQAGNARAGTDSNSQGADLILQSGAGTGTGTLSRLKLASPVTGSSGATAQAETVGLTVYNGGVQVGTAAIATNATDGFLYIPTCAGTPTGTPTSVTGLVPMVFDTTNSQFWFYTGGAWKQPKTPAGAATITWQ